MEAFGGFVIGVLAMYVVLRLMRPSTPPHQHEYTRWKHAHRSGGDGIIGQIRECETCGWTEYEPL